MNKATLALTINQQVSEMAENLVGSEIIKLAGEVKEKIQQGEKIYNMTIGDFDPAIFPIPKELKEEIIAAYQNNETNYPPANGILELRTAVANYLEKMNLFLLETSVEKKHIAPNRNNEKVIASKMSGFNNPKMMTMLTKIQSFSFYEPYFNILGQNLLSPISKPGLKKYFYHL